MATNLYRRIDPMYRVVEINPDNPRGSGDEWVASFTAEELAASGITNLTANFMAAGEGGWNANNYFSIEWVNRNGRNGSQAVYYPTTHFGGRIYADMFDVAVIATPDALAQGYDPVTP